ncbi:hypothetical protein ETD83_41340 [Actinomadura soli]|uniref:Uncharacterized protein n=1 Tax=Actinomadura soli TaxID=2508997 RepID=A0A5C4IY40_9ACTN|nr:hypothetical protein [Actinomadura soli]TMQ82260.1 hypothetical protein ETD83_41340 [Actinomadura soli]
MASQIESFILLGVVLLGTGLALATAGLGTWLWDKACVWLNPAAWRTRRPPPRRTAPQSAPQPAVDERHVPARVERRQSPISLTEGVSPRAVPPDPASAPPLVAAARIQILNVIDRPGGRIHFMTVLRDGECVGVKFRKPLNLNQVVAALGKKNKRRQAKKIRRVVKAARPSIVRFPTRSEAEREAEEIRAREQRAEVVVAEASKIMPKSTQEGFLLLRLGIDIVTAEDDRAALEALLTFAVRGAIGAMFAPDYALIMPLINMVIDGILDCISPASELGKVVTTRDIPRVSRETSAMTRPSPAAEARPVNREPQSAPNGTRDEESTRRDHQATTRPGSASHSQPTDREPPAASTGPRPSSPRTPQTEATGQPEPAVPDRSPRAQTQAAGSEEPAPKLPPAVRARAQAAGSEEPAPKLPPAVRARAQAAGSEEPAQPLDPRPNVIDPPSRPARGRGSLY